MAASRDLSHFFLDADNWFKPNHVQLALDIHDKDPSIDVVISGRTIVLDDGSILDSVPEDVEKHFADTSTSACLEGLQKHCTLGINAKQALPICDRVIYECLKSSPLKLHWHKENTLMFESHYANHYELAGKRPQTPLHDPNWEQLRAELPILLAQFQCMTGLELSDKS